MKGPQCQSCGMPIDKDPEGGGTNYNGETIRRYCSYCYRGGEFTITGVTAKEMQYICMDKMKQQGTPTWIAWLLTRQIPKLKRWTEN